MFMVNVREEIRRDRKMERSFPEDVKGEIEDVVKIIPRLPVKLCWRAGSFFQQVIAENKAPVGSIRRATG